ncbi:MAG: hypothetical protein ACE5G9_13475 [Nitrospinales bacterium]
MSRPILNLLLVLFVGVGVLGCDAYNAAVKDTKREVTEVSSGGQGTGTGTGGATSGASITVSPSNLGFSVSGSQVFTASGGAGSFTWELSGQTNAFTGATIDSFTSTSATVVFTVPTVLEGEQVLTIEATDSNGDKGSTTFTLTPATT